PATPAAAGASPLPALALSPALFGRALPNLARLFVVRGAFVGHALRPHVLAVHRRDIEFLRRLCRVRVVGPGIDAQIAHDLPAQGPARHHPLDRLFDDPLRVLAREDLALAASLDA